MDGVIRKSGCLLAFLQRKSYVPLKNWECPPVFPTKKSTKENKRMNFHQFSQQKIYKNQENEFPPVFPTKNLKNKTRA